MSLFLDQHEIYELFFRKSDLSSLSHISFILTNASKHRHYERLSTYMALNLTPQCRGMNADSVPCDKKRLQTYIDDNKEKKLTLY